MDEIITRNSLDFKEPYSNLCKAIKAIDKYIRNQSPTIKKEIYYSGEEIQGILCISKRSLQNYRDKKLIPFTTIGGKMLYPQTAIYAVLEKNLIPAKR